MSASGNSMMVERAIEGIRADLLQAVEQLEANAAQKGQSLSESAANKLLAGVDAYVAKLKKVVQAKPLGMKKQFDVAEGLLYSYNARFCAMLRAAQAHGGGVSIDELHSLTHGLSIWKPHSEAVVIHWMRKAPNSGYRPIVISGRMRPAQALMLRDTLSMMGIDSEVDCTRKGGGGERALIKTICKDIEDEYHWWWTPDIKDCFGSIKPGAPRMAPDRPEVDQECRLPAEVCEDRGAPRIRMPKRSFSTCARSTPVSVRMGPLPSMRSLFGSYGGACSRALFYHRCSRARSSTARSTLRSLTRKQSVTRIATTCL